MYIVYVYYVIGGFSNYIRAKSFTCAMKRAIDVMEYPHIAKCEIVHNNSVIWSTDNDDKYDVFAYRNGRYYDKGFSLSLRDGAKLARDVVDSLRYDRVELISAETFEIIAEWSGK